MEHEDGTKAERKSGTPQGGVVSPILSNLFLHYTFDLWMTRTHPDLPWCRYADDGLVHCRNEQEAQALKAELQARLAECRLEMHPPRSFPSSGVKAWRRGLLPRSQRPKLSRGAVNPIPKVYPITIRPVRDRRYPVEPIKGPLRGAGC